MAARGAPAILFAHGAGAGSTHPWMQDFARRLEGFAETTLFDYPYMAEGRRRPDPLPALQDAHRRSLASLRARTRGPIVLAGKSMGSRVGCHVALDEPVAGLVCFGYPLRGQGANAKLRDEVLLALRTPILFVQGTRDRLCPLDLLGDVRSKMQAPNELFVVADGDHSLRVAKRQLKADTETQEDVDRRICDRVRAFVSATCALPQPA